MKRPEIRSRSSSTRGEALGWIVILALPLVQAVRGLDMTDTGFVIVNQSLFFSEPDSVAYWFHLWLTNLFGACILALTGDSLLALRLGAAAIFWLTVYGVWRLFRGEIGQRAFLAVIAGLAAFDFAGKINIVHYNNLSLLFFTSGVAFLAKSSLSGRWDLATIAGLILAANSFVRLPNVLGLGLVLVPPALVLLTGRRNSPLRWGWSQTLGYVSGALAAFLLLFGLMESLGHLRLYAESLGFLTADAVSGEHYSLKGILKRTLGDGMGALCFGGGFLGVALALSFLTRQLTPRWLGLLVQLLGLGVTFWVLGLVFVGLSKWVYWLPVGVVYWAAVFLFFERKVHPRRFLLSVLCAAAAFLMGIGSDTGNKVSTYALILAGPGVYLAARALEERLPLAKWSTTVILGLATLAVPPLFAQVYRDSAVPEVWIDRGPALGTLTTRSRAIVVNEVVEALKDYAPPGTDLLAIDSVPMIHFLSGTHPYLGNPWPALFTEREAERALARHEGKPLPVVLAAKRNPRDPLWPNTDMPPTTSEAISRFLQENHYQLAWENQGFLLLQPQIQGKSD